LSVAKQSSNRVVIKIGTTLLADKLRGIDVARIGNLARSVSRLHSIGKRVAIVSSGAIGAGVGALGLKERPRTMADKQAVAAIGQPLLMEAYERAFRAVGLHIGQVLLTKDDLTTRGRFVNAKNTFSMLFQKGVVPIVNENDTVAVEEIKLGDNDNLAAMVAHLVEADVLIVLTNIDGLFSADPKNTPNASLIPVVRKITPELEKLARRSSTELGTGGMYTKLQAAKRCVAAGITMIITNGTNPKAIDSVFFGGFRGTVFLPKENKLSVRKKWIGYISPPKGFVVVDDGAMAALLTGQRSLLPSGVVEVHGDFKENDTISVKSQAGDEIARGATRYSSGDLQRVKGRKSGEIRHMLNRESKIEVIHKDHLVITGE
jgi:glutamate 5-kinase